MRPTHLDPHVGAKTHWTHTMPKVELHLHLEGAIPLPALWELVCKYGGAADLGSVSDLEERFAYRDFGHFIETWVWKNGFLREYADFEHIAQAVAESLRSQHIEYAEAFYSPADFFRHGLTAPELTAAIRTGLDRVEGVEVMLIADLIRDFGPGPGVRTLEELADVRDLGLIGIGIGGSEGPFPPEPWAPVYERARELDLHTTAHAGEAAGADSVRGALDALRVQRIGHGTRAVEDPALVERLAAEGVALECCPTSNVRTGVIDTVGGHPLRQLMEAGVVCTINTDDPAMFQTSMSQEFAALQADLAFSDDEIFELTRNAVRASWMTPDEKERRLGRIEQWRQTCWS